MATEPFTTCLWFDTQAKQAPQFYTSVFPGARMGPVSRYSEAGPRPAGLVMTVEFELNGQKFLALNGGPEFPFTEAVSFQIPCADQAEVDYYWDRLTAGGGPPWPRGWVKATFARSPTVGPART